EFAILHHVAQPRAIVKEMLRVARKAVIISDCNRFGQGDALARFAKLAMYMTGTWKLFDWARTVFTIPLIALTVGGPVDYCPFGTGQSAPGFICSRLPLALSRSQSKKVSLSQLSVSSRARPCGSLPS